MESPVLVVLLAVAGLIAVLGPVFFGSGVEPVRPIDPAHAAEYIGKTVLIGATKLGADERPVQQKEWVGRIARLSNEEGIVIEIEGGEAPCVLPPDLTYLTPASPGEYRLHSTQEVVDNPDFLTTWTQRDHGGSIHDLVPPNWTPAWRWRGYWARQMYLWLLNVRGLLTATNS